MFWNSGRTVFAEGHFLMQTFLTFQKYLYVSTSTQCKRCLQRWKYQAKLLWNWELGFTNSFPYYKYKNLPSSMLTCHCGINRTAERGIATIILYYTITSNLFYKRRTLAHSVYPEVPTGLSSITGNRKQYSSSVLFKCYTWCHKNCIT